MSLVVVSANLAWNLVNFRAGLIKALIADGYRVLAVAPPDPANEKRLADMGCEFEPIPIDSMGSSLLRDAVTFASIVRILRQYRPVAWLSWTIKPNVYGALAARLCGVPAVLNVSGLGTAFIKQSMVTRVVKLLYKVSLAKASVVFFQNEEDRDLFVTDKLVKPQQAQLLPGSGIDVVAWPPAFGPRPPRGRFLMIARVVADKGVREYVEAARIVKRSSPDAQFRLMGFLDVANRTAITTDEVMQWQREGLIEYLPPCDDVRPKMVEADFVVLPSYREGLSRVLIEAGASARPAVTTDVPGCRDIIRDGENGFLCPPRDAAGLADALQRALATDDFTWQAMAKSARQEVESRYSVDRVIAMYRVALRRAGAHPDVAA